ncbi:MAG: hypothetical protein JXA73_14845 [Acidobacteria bacterium]|nr:hypothetical protein [Acidobacteriota bacterium]
MNNQFDIAQADNYVKRYPDNPLSNMRAQLSTEIPEENDILVTHAYPENEALDSTMPDNVPNVTRHNYDGKLLKYVAESTHPFIPYPHFEINLKIKSGASGGPVFYKGKAICENCRGWDFGDNSDDLSHVVPVSLAVTMVVRGMQIPKVRYEHKQLPNSWRLSELAVGQLSKIGHVDFK